MSSASTIMTPMSIKTNRYSGPIFNDLKIEEIKVGNTIITNVQERVDESDNSEETLEKIEIGSKLKTLLEFNSSNPEVIGKRLRNMESIRILYVNKSKRFVNRYSMESISLNFDEISDNLSSLLLTLATNGMSHLINSFLSVVKSISLTYRKNIESETEFDENEVHLIAEGKNNYLVIVVKFDLKHIDKQGVRYSIKNENTDQVEISLLSLSFTVDKRFLKNRDCYRQLMISLQEMSLMEFPDQFVKMIYCNDVSEKLLDLLNLNDI
jgi:hypothetical protein